MGRSPVVVGDSIQALCQPAPSAVMRDKSGAPAPRTAARPAGPATTAYHACGLLHARHAGRRRGSSATRAAITAFTTLVIGHSPLLAAAALAQPEPPRVPAPASLKIEADPHRPPSPAATMLAYKLVEPWVRAWTVPAEGEALKAADDQGRTLPPVYGACVNLRLHGQLIGRGQSLAIEASARPDPAHVVRALAAAMADADPRLPAPNDLNRQAAIRLLAADVQISLELAGAPKPITDDTWTLIDTGLAPGLDGLACRSGKGEMELSFPSAMMMSNLLPQRAIRGMIANAVGEGGAAEALLKPKLIRDKHALTMASFRVSHLAQCAPGREPEFLYRGARLRSAVPDAAELREMAVQLAINLSRRLEGDTARSRPFTAYQPWNDRFEAGGGGEGNGRPTEQVLLAAGALAELSDQADRLGLVRSRPAFDGPVNAFFDGAMGPGQADPKTGVEWGLVLMTRGHLRDPSASPTPLEERARALIAQAIREAAEGMPGWAAAPPAGVDKQQYDATRFDKLTPLERSVVLCGFARSEGALDVDSAKNLERCVRRLFTDTPPDRLISLMPWLGWAEVGAADACKRAGSAALNGHATDPTGEVPSAPALRQMRAEVWKHQLSPLDAGADGADMVGGVVFTAAASTPLPSWQTVRPIAFIATMLGDDRLTEPAERDLETYRLLAAFRFLRQLQADDSCGWMCPNPEAAIGGIRAATWDQSMPPDATSLTFLATCELLKSMDKLAAAKASESGARAEPAKAP